MSISIAQRTPCFAIRRSAIVVGWLLLGLSLMGCQKVKLTGLHDRLVPSNERDWSPEVATVPRAEVNGPQFTLRNIRNCKYASSEDFVVNYYDRQILIDQIRAVDFIVVPFNGVPKLAHTMMSFGLDDGSYLAVSVEVRKERGEKFNAVKGFGNKFELIYVLSDERDVIRLRTRFRKSDVYVYPTVATPEQAQTLFADVITRVNKLAVEPEFYNSISNNCTTNIAGHVNQLSPDKITYGWKVLLPGLSAEYAYELGLLDNRVPFEDLKSTALINELAETNFDDPLFSQKIRSRRSRIEQYLVRQSKRESTMTARGDEFLQSQKRSLGGIIR
ncbi:MAG: hypothetical protein ACI814_002910 [Mariniblastus sp.]|jgi:hypothetical protein